MRDLKLFLQRVGALCNALRDCRQKVRSDIRTEASAILRDVEREIAAMRKQSAPDSKPEDDAAK